MLMKGKRWSVREVNGEVIVEEVKVEEKEEKNNMFIKKIKKIKEMIDKKQIEYERRQRRANCMKGNYNEVGFNLKGDDNEIIELIKYTETILGYGVDEVEVDTDKMMLKLRWGVL